jgi:hypothetical protein
LIVDVLVGFPLSLTSMSPVRPRTNVGGVLVTETTLEGVGAGVVVPGAVADELVQPARSAAVANAANAITRPPDFRAKPMLSSGPTSPNTLH